MLVDMVEKIGKKWKLLSQVIRGRSPQSLKNRYYYLLRRNSSLWLWNQSGKDKKEKQPRESNGGKEIEELSRLLNEIVSQ